MSALRNGLDPWCLGSIRGRPDLDDVRNGGEGMGLLCRPGTTEAAGGEQARSIGGLARRCGLSLRHLTGTSSTRPALLTDGNMDDACRGWRYWL
jgi:hypothetical protein